jgi:tryptophanyl-tRNA synthetase
MHLGHYFSVIRPAIDLDADVLIAQYHAPQSTVEDTNRMFDTLMKFGLSEEGVLFQSETFDADLYFKLLSLTRMGELERMTQFRGAMVQTAHLFVYPVLMAHDVAGYQEIVVGEDQAQHLNFARDLLERYNKAFHPYGKFPVNVPTANPVGGRIMSLSDPVSKMSKSAPDGCVFLDDSEDDIRAKVKAAVMDEAGRENLVELYYACGGVGSPPDMNSEFKPMVADRIVAVTAPARAIP